MAAEAMHRGVVKFDITAGATAVTDISSGVVGFSCSFAKNIGSHFTLDSDWEKQTVGGRRGSGTIRVVTDKTASSAHDVLSDFVLVADESDRRTLELYSPDATTGSIKIAGECVLEAANNILNVEGGSGETQIADFPYRFDGAVTFAVVSP